MNIAALSYLHKPATSELQPAVGRKFAWSHFSAMVREFRRRTSAVRMLFPPLVQWATQTARLMVGIPDYQAYLRHHQVLHRGEPVMTYEEFFRERQDACYAPEKGAFRGIC